jgi:hypothetical protein
MRKRRVGSRSLLAVAATAALIAAAPATASSHARIKLKFEKTCPELTCEGSLLRGDGRPIPGTAVRANLTPLWLESGVLGYSSTETVSAPWSSFTMNLVGVLDQNAEPDVTYVIGSVVSGSWGGTPLAGGLVRSRAERTSGTTFRGTLRISPPAEG